MRRRNKGITLIALVITIIVLLILAGVSIAMLTGDNGILTQANNANTQQSHAAVREGISLAYNEWQIELKTSSNTKIASTEKVTIQGKEERRESGTSTTFLDFLVSKNYVDETTKIINVENLTGSKQSLGNGTGTDDVYKIEEDDSNYKVVYYENSTTTTEISTIQKETDEDNPFSYTQADIEETLKYFNWEMVDVTEENREEYGYDESIVGKRVAIITGTKENYYTSGKGGTFPLKKIVIPKTIDDSDYVDIQISGFNYGLSYLKNLETIIYLNDLGTFYTTSCYDLKNVKLTSNNEIGYYVECTNLENVSISENITEIGYRVFSYCTNLKELKIPKTVTEIYQYDNERYNDSGPFYRCPNLTITVEAGSPLTIDHFENTGIDVSKVIFE